MKSPAQLRFLALTHIDPDYFLELICKFLRPQADFMDLGSGNLDDTFIRFIDEFANTTAMVTFHENSIVITKEKE